MKGPFQITKRLVHLVETLCAQLRALDEICKEDCKTFGFELLMHRRLLESSECAFHLQLTTLELEQVGESRASILTNKAIESLLHAQLVPLELALEDEFLLSTVAIKTLEREPEEKLLAMHGGNDLLR